MTPFTDEDLRRLKEDLITFRKPGTSPYSDYGAIKNLLARLEAAEEIVDQASDAEPNWENYPCYKKWRKAAGK